MMYLMRDGMRRLITRYRPHGNAIVFELAGEDIHARDAWHFPTTHARDAALDALDMGPHGVINGVLADAERRYG